MLYIYPPSGPHRACNGITLPFTHWQFVPSLFPRLSAFVIFSYNNICKTEILTPVQLCVCVCVFYIYIYIYIYIFVVSFLKPVDVDRAWWKHVVHL